MFNKKRIRELEAANANLQRRCADHEEINLKNMTRINTLIRTIRDMDQIIWTIGQMADGSWATIRPQFSQLHDQMTARKVAESSVVEAVVESRLHEVYADESATLKRITKGKP